jgi:DNA-binding transcriptional ArsR family regulator
VSHHLKILREAGVLEAERAGREVYLRVNREVLEQTLSTVLDYVRTES